MDRCPVPWSDTTPPPLPTPPQQHTPTSTQDDPSVDVGGGSPPSRRTSPSSPAAGIQSDTIQLAYSSAVEPPPEGMTVIRGLKSLSPGDHSPAAGEQLVYQTLGDGNSFMGQYYAGSFSPNPPPTVGSPSAYEKCSYVKVPYYQAADLHMVSGKTVTRFSELQTEMLKSGHSNWGRRSGISRAGLSYRQLSRGPRL
ncbi:hypothetical protein AVEN_172497-1 [Araneus ventricosus]|uniref:Uncharacterized protein n=1 Tax=Araneus ventricosus TaxID=182803 RepID=A0A4Y2DSK7_ARAVE|nr:hypothetical protein AVEN_172497-1 [Araneus ventricosus]